MKLTLTKTTNLDGSLRYEISLENNGSYPKLIKGFASPNEALEFFDNYTPVDTTPVVIKEREI